MKARETKYFEEKIVARISELDARSDGTVDSRATVMLDQQSIGRLSRMDATQRKAVADATERLRQNERRTLKAALRRLQEGVFGECVDCGEAIEHARLEVSPAIATCMDCAKG